VQEGGSKLKHPDVGRKGGERDNIYNAPRLGRTRGEGEGTRENKRSRKKGPGKNHRREGNQGSGQGGTCERADMPAEGETGRSQNKKRINV